MKSKSTNLIIASALLGISALISLAADFYFYPRPDLFTELTTFTTTILIAYLVLKGYNWIKWVLVLLWCLGLPLYIWGLIYNHRSVIMEIPNLITILLQLLSLSYQFLPRKKI